MKHFWNFIRRYAFYEGLFSVSIASLNTVDNILEFLVKQKFLGVENTENILI